MNIFFNHDLIEGDIAFEYGLASFKLETPLSQE